MYLVFDIGGTFVKYGLLDEKGTIHEKGKFPTVRDDLNIFLQHLEDIYHQHQDVKGIAISAPGRIDIQTGLSEGGAVSCLHGKSLIQELTKRCDHKPVSIENDGKCAGLAEAWLGAAKDVQDCCVLAFGTGIAGAIVKNKKVDHGAHMIAGEVSYIQLPLNRQDMNIPYFGRDSSTIGLVRRVEEALKVEKGSLNGEKIYQMLDNPIVSKVLEDVYFEIAIQIFNLQYIVDPELFCIGGGVSEQPLFIQGIQKYIDKIYDFNQTKVKQHTKPQITVCKFRNDSNLIGALYHYKQFIEKKF